MTGRVAVLKAYGGEFELREYPVPDPEPGAILINTARGGIVNESDLVQALLTNRIAGAGLDVFESEPLPADSPLLTMRNVVLTPHAAGITPEATEAGLALAIENVFAFLAGQPANVVL